MVANHLPLIPFDNDKGIPQMHTYLVADLSPFLRAGCWSEAVAPSVVFNVLRDVLPRELAAARASVGALAAKAFDVGDPEAKEASL